MDNRRPEQPHYARQPRENAQIQSRPLAEMAHSDRGGAESRFESSRKGVEKRDHLGFEAGTVKTAGERDRDALGAPAP